MVDNKTGRGSDQFMLRFPDGMRERIKAAADENGRSMNAEIVQVLEREYPEPTDLDAQEVIEQFLMLPKDVREGFLHDWLEKNVSDEDVRSGLVSGVRLKK